MIRRKFDHPHVVLCRTCCGRGFLENLDELADTVHTVACPACKGSGRVVVSSVTLTTVEPYDPESPNLAMYGKDGMNEYLLLSVEKLESLKSAMEDMLDESRLRCREGWHKRDRAFRPQSFRKRTIWHRIRSRCF